MDFLNRNGQQSQPARPAASGVAPQQPVQKHDDGPSGHFGRDHWNRIPGWLRIANVVLLFSITILAVAVTLMLQASNPREGQYVVEDKYQAVFLENGQVYFGKVASLTSKYIDLQNVFYLNSNKSTTDTDSTDAAANQFTLVKLGCELHGPYDQMVINRDQVTFWENLKDDGQVVKTIKEWIKQNPNGQKCSTSTNSTDQSTGATTQSSTGTQSATGTTSTTGTTNKSN